MKLLLTCVFMIIALCTSAEAEDIFPDTGINELLVIAVDKNAGEAWIQDRDGTNAEVVIGDAIGIEQGIIIEIEEASITIQRGNTRTKMPVVYGFE